MVNTAIDREPHNKQKGKHGSSLVLMLDSFRGKCFPERLHEIILGWESCLWEPMWSWSTWITILPGVSYVPYCCGQIHDKKWLQGRRIYPDSQFKWIMEAKTWRQVQKAQWREIEVNWLWLHPQSGSNEWTGEDTSSHQWPSPSNQVPHLKSFVTFSHIPVGGDQLFKHRSLLRTAQFTFKLEDWATSIFHQNSMKETQADVPRSQIPVQIVPNAVTIFNCAAPCKTHTHQPGTCSVWFCLERPFKSVYCYTGEIGINEVWPQSSLKWCMC